MFATFDQLLGLVQSRGFNQHNVLLFGSWIEEIEELRHGFHVIHQKSRMNRRKSAPLSHKTNGGFIRTDFKLPPLDPFNQTEAFQFLRNALSVTVTDTINMWPNLVKLPFIIRRFYRGQAGASGAKAVITIHLL